MSTCKECLHFNMCLLSSEKAGICKEFKDRSKFIELPCKVGDVVYAVSKCNNKIFSKKVVEILLKEDNGYVYTEPCYFIFEDFGKIVFLTKEEAEKALKERENI